jgi:hypothetical protein
MSYISTIERALSISAGVRAGFYRPERGFYEEWRRRDRRTWVLPQRRSLSSPARRVAAKPLERPKRWEIRARLIAENLTFSLLEPREKKAPAGS